MFVHATAAHTSSSSPIDLRVRSRSRPRRETPSPNVPLSTLSSSEPIALAAPFVPRGPPPAKASDPHGQGAVLPPVPLNEESNKNSRLPLDVTARRRRSSSVATVDSPRPLHTLAADSKASSPEKKGHAHRSSWQRRLSFGGSAALSATSLDRLDGVQRRSSISSPKSPRKPDVANSDVEKEVTVDAVPVLPRTVYDISTGSTTATPTGPAVAAPWTQSSSASPSEPFGPRTTSLRSPQAQERPRQASVSRSSRNDESAEARDRPRRLQKRNASLDTASTRRNLSQDTTASAASQETVREGEGDRTDKQFQKERRERDKKSMLSRALQKAHTAVLLDNAQNYEGAIQAYADACELLQQVLIRSSLEDDRRKLDAIRKTYDNRILELRQLSPNSQINGNRKSLPDRPMSDSLSDQSPQLTFEAANDNDGDDEDEDSDEEPVVIETATVTRLVPEKSLDSKPEPQPPQNQLLPHISLTTSNDSAKTTTKPAPNGGLLLRLQSDETPPLMEERFLTLESPMDVSYIPPPLSPRRLPSDESRQDDTPKDSPLTQTQTHQSQSSRAPAEPQQQNSSGHQSISWLDTIDESARNSVSSATSSVHSLAGNGYFMKKHLRELSTATEAEFDAALDAAVEAAYDDGLEPFEFSEAQTAKASQDRVATALANVQMARDRVKEVEREEAILAAHRRHLALRMQKVPGRVQAIGANGATNNFPDEDLDAKEEERILDEMTKDYLIDGFDFGLGGPDKESKGAPPQPLRQSDSSTYSGRTWNTSTSSSRTTGGSSLSAVLEHAETTNPPGKVSNGLPPLDEEARPSTASETSSMTARALSSSGQRDSLRLRRLSGQNAKQLKIETNVPPPTHQPATAGPHLQEATLKVDPPAQSTNPVNADLQTLPDSVFKPPGPALQQPTPQGHFAQLGSPMRSVSPRGDPAMTGSPASLAPVYMPTEAEGMALPASPTASKVPPRPQVRKNKSSLSLTQRQMSVSSPDSPDNASIGTPLSTVSNHSRKALPPQQPSFQPPTPGLPLASAQPVPANTGPDGTLNLPSAGAGGISLFESADLHSPIAPGSPNSLALNAPIPLEPCPGPYFLRPFWLLRCVYQTIAHPRGGYLSTRLFVPRDVWRVKGVKIKSVEEKIGNCDLLTAALGRLAAVDTFDADAVLEEMQQLETVFDQVQANLAKKLGSEVGVHGLSSLFKDVGGSTGAEGGAGGMENGGVGLGGMRTASGTVTGGKSYLSGWRKLRSKGSSVNLPTTSGSFAGSGGLSAKDKSEAAGWTMTSVPMTNLPNIRFAKRDIWSLDQALEGPNRTYMGAVARLCDAVQVIDQIARQVEDPGLKHSSPTHVGLELCTRHASEFFGFYICRFVLSDLGMLMDKFIKKGSEWVLI